MATTFTTTRLVEFSDTDLAGIVHFSRFFVYMEAAEHAFLRSIGTHVVDNIAGQRIGWPRVAATCDYRAPAYFEDELDIIVEITRKGQKSLTYSHTFRRGEDLIAEGSLTVVCCVVEHGKPMRTVEIPKAIAEKIEDTA